MRRRKERRGGAGERRTGKKEEEIEVVKENLKGEVEKEGGRE